MTIEIPEKVYRALTKFADYWLWDLDDVVEAALWNFSQLTQESRVAVVREYLESGALGG